MTEHSQPDDLPTCGKGLAAHAPLPQTLGDLMAAVGEILELHRRALDPDDPAAREEDDAYRDLAERHRAAAARLRETAERMTASRDLPMGRHDLSALGDEPARAAFAEFVRLEQLLLSLLEARLPADEAMLAEMLG